MEREVAERRFRRDEICVFLLDLSEILLYATSHTKEGFNEFRKKRQELMRRIDDGKLYAESQKQKADEFWSRAKKKRKR